MFRPTPSLQSTSLRRMPLSSKQAGKDYYKGNRVGSMGTIDKFAAFHRDVDKMRTFVYPKTGIKNFELTPFVTATTSRYMTENGERWQAASKVITGQEYLSMWKNSGGHDDPKMR